MNRFGIAILLLVLFQLSTNPAHALGFPRKPNPTPNPTPTPTPIPTPCSTAGPWVDHDPDEYVVHMKGTNGAWVIAECGGDDTGKITVDSFGMGEWETFYVKPLGNGNVAIRTSHNRWLSAQENGGADVHANRQVIGGWETFRLEGSLANGSVVGFQTGNGKWLTARLDTVGIPFRATADGFGPWEQFVLEVVYAPPVPARKGIVRADHRSIVDDDGPFYPLGATLFWALRGWKFERERVKANLQFLKTQKWDYVRILGEVDWADNDINPAWPDYDQNLGEFLDYAYNECGLRTEITVIGGGHEDQAMALTQRIASVVRAGREHMIMNFEVANEWFGRRLSKDDLRAIGKYLRQQFPNHMVAISSDGFDTFDLYKSEFMRSDSANLATTHMDRTQGDEGWREVRQNWDYKDQNFPVSHNEPIGPRSSVAQDDDPVRLAMLRAVGLINGVTAFVLHNANGVAGRPDPSRNRQANLFELANADAIYKAVRGVDAFFPPRVGEGQHWNNAWTGNPCVADAIWGDEGNRGVNRNYTVSTGDGWVSTEAGVKDHVNMRITRKSHVEVFDVIQGKVMELDLEAGQSFVLSPVSRDNFGNGGFIIVGRYR